MENVKILIADNEIGIRMAVRDSLEEKGYQTLEAENGEEVLDIFSRNKKMAMIILDVEIQQKDGWEVIREVRRYSKVPILVLTAKNEEEDVLRGFDLGIDEYICKPFSPKILAARVDAILRRSNSFLLQLSSKVKAGVIEIDRDAHIVNVDGESVELTLKEFELLVYFVENNGIALSREQILYHVWNYDYCGDIRTVNTHVRRIRDKLGKREKYIKTIWGVGYKFEI